MSTCTGCGAAPSASTPDLFPCDYGKRTGLECAAVYCNTCVAQTLENYGMECATHVLPTCTCGDGAFEDGLRPVFTCVDCKVCYCGDCVASDMVNYRGDIACLECK